MSEFDFGKPTSPRASRRKRNLPSLGIFVLVSVALVFFFGPCVGVVVGVVLGFVWWNWA